MWQVLPHWTRSYLLEDFLILYVPYTAFSKVARYFPYPYDSTVVKQNKNRKLYLIFKHDGKCDWGYSSLDMWKLQEANITSYSRLDRYSLQYLKELNVISNKEFQIIRCLGELIE